MYSHQSFQLLSIRLKSNFHEDCVTIGVLIHPNLKLYYSSNGFCQTLKVPITKPTYIKLFIKFQRYYFIFSTRFYANVSKFHNDVGVSKVRN